MYFLRELPNPDKHLDLFYEFKRKNESLGLAKIATNDIDSEYANMENEIQAFFRNAIKGLPFNYRWGHADHQAESYIKTTYLAQDYLRDHKFHNPMCAHWNTRQNKFNVHPGRDRAKVLELFNVKESTCIVFNTNGHKVNFIETFDTKEELIKFFEKSHGGKIISNQEMKTLEKDSKQSTQESRSWYMWVVADHSALIPHIYIDSHRTYTKASNTYKLLQQFWNDHRVTHNFERFTNDPIIWNKGSKPLYMKAYTHRGMLKGWVLAPFLMHSYQDKDVRIQIF